MSQSRALRQCQTWTQRVAGPGWAAAQRGAAQHGAAAEASARARLDTRRALQLGLAGLWLLDAVLQYQSVMFTRSFPAMLASSAAGNPAFIAGPITGSARLIQAHLATANGVFATIQLALGLGIAWRPAARAALAASVVWSLAVWWLGEGFGQLLAGTASPVNGAPGPVILYALLALLLLWPTRPAREAKAGRPPGTAQTTSRGPARAGRRETPAGQEANACPGSGRRPVVAAGRAGGGEAGVAVAQPGSGEAAVALGGGAGAGPEGDAVRTAAAAAPEMLVKDGAAGPGGGAGTFVAAGLIGSRAARVVWLVLWGSLAYLAVQPAVRAPRALSGLLAEAADGEPGWLARLDGHAASALGPHGLAASIVLAVLLAIVAIGIFGPPRWVKGVIVLAVLLAALIWAAQGFGGLLSGASTDPESGPLLALIAVAYWPVRGARPIRAAGLAWAARPALTARPRRPDRRPLLAVRPRVLVPPWGPGPSRGAGRARRRGTG
jgi:hypothetical protein